MPPKPRKEQPDSGAPGWICTFSDMMSLLLCFFILLFAMSTLEKKQMIQASGSMRAAFGGLPAPYLTETIPDKRTKPEISQEAQTEKKESYSKDELRVEEERKVKDWGLQNVIQVTGCEQGIMFRVSGDALFNRGSAKVTEKGFVVLSRLAEELIQFPKNPVIVGGYTDNNPNPMKNGNWLLGAERAYNVMRYLVDYGCRYGQVNEKRFSYESYSEFSPLTDVKPNTAIGQALNRRVEITLVQSDEGDGTYRADPSKKNPRTPLIDVGDVQP